MRVGADAGCPRLGRQPWAVRRTSALPRKRRGPRGPSRSPPRSCCARRRRRDVAGLEARLGPSRWWSDGLPRSGTRAGPGRGGEGERSGRIDERATSMLCEITTSRDPGRTSSSISGQAVVSASGGPGSGAAGSLVWRCAVGRGRWACTETSRFDRRPAEAVARVGPDPLRATDRREVWWRHRGRTRGHTRTVAMGTAGALEAVPRHQSCGSALSPPSRRRCSGRLTMLPASRSPAGLTGGRSTPRRAASPRVSPGPHNASPRGRQANAVRCQQRQKGWPAGSA